MSFKLNFHYRISNVVLLACCCLTSITLQAAVQFQSNDTLKRTSIEVLNQLKLNHYRYLSVDNEFSSRLFDKYLDQLDPSRSYFLASDVEEFEEYRYALDNELNRGNLEPAFTMFARYQTRMETRLNWLISSVEDGIKDFDFTRDENLEADRENVDWAKTSEELDELWRKRLKNSVLNLKLADKSLEEIGPLLDKRYRNQLNRLGQTRVEDAFQVYMNVVTQSYDPHTEYFAPRRSENFNINMSLSLEGIGAVLQSDQEFTKVVRLITGGPADLAGDLKPADKIIGVAQGDNGEFKDVVGWRLDEVVQLIRGPKGTKVRLEIIPNSSENDQPTEIVIERNKVLLEEQAASSKIIPVPLGEKEFKIGIIEIPTFYADFAAYQSGDPHYKSTTRDVAKLLEDLKKENVDGVVVDLRNNGGGALNEANALTGLFIKTGATVQVRNARGKVKIFTDPNPDVLYDGPLAVVVNRLSASASEIFAGAIQDYQRGLVLGGQTFGKGTVQTLLPLDQGQLKITQAKFYRISGESTQHQGVIPDITFPAMVDLDEIGEDALDGALPWDTIRPVLHKKAGNVTPYVGKLAELHEERIVTNPDYQFRVNQINRASDNRKRTSISLNEKQRLQEQEESKSWQLMQENQRRKLKQQPLLVSLSDVKTEADADVSDSEETDPYLVESSHILVDWIKLSESQLAQN